MTYRYSVDVAGREQEVTVEALGSGRYRVSIGGREQVVDARRVATSGRGATWSIVPEGGGPQTLVDVAGRAPELQVAADGASFPLKIEGARKRAMQAALRPPQAEGKTTVRSPMPGKVVKVLARAGDAVKSGQGLIVVEAMKMENELRAPRDGKIAQVMVAEGQAVEASQALATIE